jgi:hypothetical protein
VASPTTPDANSPRGAGGQEWSFVSLNFGFPARAVSSAMPYGSERIGQ